MAHLPRITAQGVAYHVINRRVMCLGIFPEPADYAAFERILIVAQQRPDALDLLGYCLMPNHWHLVLWPRPASNLSTWMQWLTVTHAHRWHQHYHCAGEGPLYQGRFRSFPIQEDGHLLTVLRYAEANPLRAGMVMRAEQWKWSSLSLRHRPLPLRPRLGPPPLPLPCDWIEMVNQRQDQSELGRLRGSVVRGSPLGEGSWVEKMIARLGLQRTQRPRGRPRRNREISNNRHMEAINSS